MKILMYSKVWAPSVGGVQSVTSTLARGLARAPGESDGDEIDLTLATPVGPKESRNQEGLFRIVRSAGIFLLVRLLRKSDIVHLAGPALVPLCLSWLFRKKAVVHHHGYQAVCPDGSLVHYADQRVCRNSFATGGVRECIRCRAAKLGWLRGIASVALAYPRLWLCRSAAANITVSRHVDERLALPRSTTIYSAPAESPAAPLAALLKPEPAHAPVAASDVPLIAFVGRLTTEKGAPILLHAAASLAAEGASFRVRIIGDGPERERLAVLTWALRLRDRVEFTGMLLDAALETAVSSAIAVVLPSLVEETAGLVAIEQMMQGRVVIASDTGGLSEIVGSAGLKFPPGDIPALAACLRRVLSDPELCATLGRAARSRALELFTKERMVEDHLQLYRRILARQPRMQPPTRAIPRTTLLGRQKRAG